MVIFFKTNFQSRFLSSNWKTKRELKKVSRKLGSEIIDPNTIGSIREYDPSLGNTFLTFATAQILTELRNFLHSIRIAYMENYYPDDEDGEGDWAGASTSEKTTCFP